MPSLNTIRAQNLVKNPETQIHAPYISRKAQTGTLKSPKYLAAAGTRPAPDSALCPCAAVGRRPHPCARGRRLSQKINMDWTWMNQSKYSREYLDGVDEFIQFAFESCGNTSIKCPCLRCACTHKWKKEIVREHLYFNGVIKDKEFWKFHGSGSASTKPSTLSSSCEHPFKDGDMHRNINEVESPMLQGCNSAKNQLSSSKCVASVASVLKEQLQGKKVKLLDLEEEEVASGIVISEEKGKMVMGKVLGDDYYEILVLLATKPDAPLFVKDAKRSRMRDVVGGHIVWLKDYVQLDV